MKMVQMMKILHRDAPYMHRPLPFSRVRAICIFIIFISS